MSVHSRIEVSTETEALRASGGKLALARNLVFALLIAASACAFFAPLERLYAVSRGSDEYSYILLIPVIVLGLFYLEKERIFRRVAYAPRAGLALMAAGAATAAAGVVFAAALSVDGRLFLEILGLVVFWIGSFVLCYGKEAARTAIFPLLFSVLFVPLPDAWMARPIALIQHGSADVTALLFGISGIPVFREGLVFTLPGLTFVVATECSGIHSSTALFIASILAGRFALQAGWKRVLVVLAVPPIVMFTNGLRMFILAILAVYVDPAFFFGNLHKKGGVFFFALALIILALLVKLLRARLALAPVRQKSESADEAVHTLP